MQGRRSRGEVAIARTDGGASEVASALEVGEEVGTGQLVEGEAVAARSVERPARALGQLERTICAPASRAQSLGLGSEVGDTVDEDGALALDVVGEQEPRWGRGQLHHGHPSAHRLDGEHDPSTEDIGQVGEVGGHVPARLVEVVEGLEGHRLPSITADPCSWKDPHHERIAVNT